MLDRCNGNNSNKELNKMKRTLYIYERLNWETGVKKRSYSYYLNPNLGEVIGTKEVEVEEEKKEKETEETSNEPTP